MSLKSWLNTAVDNIDAKMQVKSIFMMQKYIENMPAQDFSNRRMVGMGIYKELYSPILNGWNFSNADIDNLTIRHGKLFNVNFKGAKIRNMNFIASHMAGANFENVDFPDIAKGEAVIDFAKSSLAAARFSANADFSAIDLSKAHDIDEVILTDNKGKIIHGAKLELDDKGTAKIIFEKPKKSTAPAAPKL